MQVLNKYDKEQLVIKLHQEGKTMREVSHIVHMSFGDIGKIIQRIEGRDNDINLTNKSKATRALWLFEQKKRPIDVAIELDIPYSEVIELQQEYWALNNLYGLALACMELKNDLSSFIELYKLLKQNKVLDKKHILKFINYANEDLPTLEDRCQKLSSITLELQFQKKQLGDEVAKLSSSLLQLNNLQKRYQMEIEKKKQIISNLDQQLNQKIYMLEEKQSSGISH